MNHEKSINLYLSLGRMNLHLTDVREAFEKFLKSIIKDVIIDIVSEWNFKNRMESKIDYEGYEEDIHFDAHNYHLLNLMINDPDIENYIYDNNFGIIFRPLRDLIKYFMSETIKDTEGQLKLGFEPKLVTPSILIINLKGAVK